MLPVWLRIDLDMKSRGTTKPLPNMHSMRSAAVHLGCSAPQLRDVIFLGTNAGGEFEQRVADKIFDGNVMKLRHAAERWAAGEPWEGNADDAGQPAAGPTLVRPERYDAMSIARDMALGEGYDPAFVESFEVHLDADDQPGPEYLWTLMKAAWATHKRKTAPKGDPLADLDSATSLRDARKKR